MAKRQKDGNLRFVAALHAKAEDLRRSLSAKHPAQVLGRLEDPSDEGDLSLHSHEEWIFSNRSMLDSQVLREVQAALKRVDEGQFGICQECGEPISPKRLEALPWARYCVRCQEMSSQSAETGDASEAAS
jgi:DnaK suppressor protein